MHLYKRFIVVLLFILCPGSVFATHYFGIDMFYTHVSGNTYRLTIVSFGDCSGELFPSFSTTRPKVYIQKGSTDILSDFLDQEAPKEGVEVTNGCPADLAKTTCKDPNGTVPGVKKFVYSKEFTLPSQAADWKFVYRGETDGTALAGRSNSLTNVSPAGVIKLEAALDNTLFNNSSPQFNSIATQFYCINTPVEYNLETKDADGDSLVYELIPAMEGQPQSNPVKYVTGYTGNNPLAAANGTFKFDAVTGLLSFTPHMVQKAVVVYRVLEYRNGVLIGSVMREMTVVVLPCTNNPPVGFITNAKRAKIVDSVTVETCLGNHELSFEINPSDAQSGQIVTMVPGNLPTGARLDISNNNTPSPTSKFVWGVPNLPEGNYTFHITYSDDGCPFAQRKQPYTIRVKADSIFADATAAPCRSSGGIKVTTLAGWAPWDCQVYRDATLVYNKTGMTAGSWNDSASIGKYKVYATNHLGCTAESDAEVTSSCWYADLPTAFSPNGDGKNDLFFMRSENVQEMHLRIYNRWGQLVFETHDPKQGWDGKYNGQDAPIEAYAYVLNVLFKNNEVMQRQGNVTLLR